MSMKNLSILGSTGSIGTQALEVVAANPDKFKIVALTAGRNAELLIEQCLAFRPKVAVIGQKGYQRVKEALAHTSVEVMSGEEALCHACSLPEADTVLTAVVGYAGLRPTLAAIRAGKEIALANKETLVVAGEMVMEMAKKHGSKIHPVDSEHSAIYQCLLGEEQNPIEKIILTASGGPFRGKKQHELRQVTKAEALKHPNWEMGAKITIDSATLMNKGLEVIEAKWLFGVAPDQIEVVVHPQSIIHSVVQFTDGSMKAQMGLPDMKLPIQFALTWPNRISSSFPRFNFAQYPQLTFEQPDTDTFRNLHLAFGVLQRSGNMPCALNAANEVAVAKFLQNEIGFLEIAELNEKCLQKIGFVAKPSLDDYIATDREVREMAASL